MNLPYIEKIWRAEGSLMLDEPQSADEAFDRLDPLFKTNGTTYQIDGDTLTYKKDNPAAQDKLATFTSGTVRMVQEPTGTRLDYDVKSPALLMVFLAPLLFLAFGQLAVVVNAWDTSADDETEQSEKAEEEEEEQEVKLHPIDEFLGAPQPETLEEKKQREEEKEEEDEGKHNPIPAFVLAALFAILYGLGRVLEPYLLRKTFRKYLSGEVVEEEPSLPSQSEA